MTTGWSQDDARHTWSIPNWGDGYFDVGDDGALTVRPQGADGPVLSLPEIVDAARSRGSRLPLLVRFSDILHDRRSRLQQAFAKASQEWNYSGGYTAIYPIKVNQQKGVAGELASQGGEGFGLEAGSKPELMAVLALARAGSMVICNGYKDREYVRLALIGRKLGLDIYIVIEKPSELLHVIEEARALGVEPLLGVRMRLKSLGAGKWQNSGGDKAKFGLTPRQLLTLVDDLKAAKLDHCLRLLHFHMGSQMSNVRDIANGMREAVRYFVELSRMGLPIKVMDVGGGLGVDYEGTRSRSDCSINYSMDLYASAVIGALSAACTENGIDAPHVLTESGRAMTAHHAVLI
ncbi:MAG: biosynthetic arginine decarboxylase, partial [Dokdonella sp.]